MVKVAIQNILEGAGAKPNGFIHMTDPDLPQTPTGLFQSVRNTVLSFINLITGSNVVLLRSESDLPTPAGGVITLEQNKEYKVIAPFDYATPIQPPAGWNGVFSAEAYQTNTMTYKGAGSAFRTLNLDGAVTLVENSTSNPGTHSTITSVAHGLENGQYVNLVGMSVSAYNGVALLISNKTNDTFDVEIVFTFTAIGTFDTGVFGFDHNNLVLIGDLSNNAFDITISKAPNSSVKLLNSEAVAFNDIGIIRNGIIVIDVYGSASLEKGLILENCDTGNIEGVLHANLNPASTTAIGLIIQGNTTRALALDKYRALMTNALQRACRMDSTIINSSISLTKCSHEVAANFFDLSTGGLDQTTPQILANQNDTIPDSMASMQMGFTVGPLITDVIEVMDLIQDVPQKLGAIIFTSSNLERATVSNTGRITNLTKKTRQYAITFNILFEKNGGGTTDIGVLLVKNDVLDLSATFEIPHSVNSGIIQISATRNFELAENEFLDPAVVNFRSVTAQIDITQISVEYSESV